jgi:hypothetical protein
MEQLDKNSAYIANRDAFGRVRIWSLNRDKKHDALLLDQPNLITREGASIAAKALTGGLNTAISHIYVGYNDDGAVPSVDLSNTIASFGDHARVALAFSPSFSNETDYTANLVYFTVYVTGTTVPNGKKITSLGLVNSTVPGNAAYDKLFSKIAFSPVTYDSSHGLAITWGLTFRAQD